MLIETLLAKNNHHEISHVFIRNHMAFFKIQGESFCTAAGHISHSSSPMYDSAPMRIFALTAHDEQAAATHQQMMEEVDHETALWEKHKQQLYRQIFTSACEVMVRDGDAAMMVFIDEHLDVMPNMKALEIMRKIGT